MLTNTENVRNILRLDTRQCAQFYSGRLKPVIVKIVLRFSDHFLT